jgi:putative peptidoglycan lipid II flippase
LLYRHYSAIGLAISSDIGIIVNTMALAVLLHWRNLVRLSGLNWNEIGKAALAAAVAGWLSHRIGNLFLTRNDRVGDMQALGVILVTWGAAAVLVLWITRSELANDLRRRKQTPYPRVAEAEGELGTMEP